MSAPNEVYRKDLVSAMLITELPESTLYFQLQDNWKTEWERGVQVPAKQRQRVPQIVELENAPQPPIEVQKGSSRYCLDNLDSEWLKLANEHRTAAGLSRLTEDDLEIIINELETQANSSIRQKCNNKSLKSLEDNTVCDVCRSPNGEDGNELVFCDGCDICVHQHCYGITTIDENDWYCHPCQENLKPKCYLCGQYGGSMKRSKDSKREWVHIQCALWIPEVTMGNPEKMSDPDISNIPESRMSLKCFICQNAIGCIQCNVKRCFKSYHVTCAVRNGQSVQMEHKGGNVNLISNCDKHTAASTDDIRKRKTSIDMQVDEERRSLEENFFTLVKLEHAEKRLNEYTMETLDWVYEYWRLKRKSKRNEQLLRDDDKEPEAVTTEQRYRKITQLRTDLEKSRNLLCLIIKREKVKRQILRCDREIKLKELKYLGQKVQLSELTVSELSKNVTEHEIKTEADVAANFLEEHDFSPKKKEPDLKKIADQKPIKRRPGPKSITRPNEPKAMPTFDQESCVRDPIESYVSSL